jgi:hypothetical protein
LAGPLPLPFGHRKLLNGMLGRLHKEGRAACSHVVKTRVHAVRCSGRVVLEKPLQAAWRRLPTAVG